MTRNGSVFFGVSLAIGLMLLVAGCDGETATGTPVSTPTATQLAVCTPPACGPDEAIVCPDECPGGCGSVCATVTPTPVVETDTPTPIIMCTPPACDPGEVIICPDECPGGCGSVCATVTPTPVGATDTPTPMIMCTPPACGAGQVIICPDECPGGCGSACATVTPPVVTLTPTAVTPPPAVVCTPPACGPDEIIVCPGECPGGCGSVCATVTPDPTSQARTESLCQKGEEVLFSCRLPSEKAMVSICGSPNLAANRGSVQLRWGASPGDIQFSYPGSVRNPQDYFRFARYTGPNVSYTTLSFSLGPTEYAVYDNYNSEAGRDEHQAGVVIASPKSEEKMDAPCGGEVTGSLLALEPVIPRQEWQEVRPAGMTAACRDTKPTGRFYLVQGGDCLYRIGLAYDLPWTAIARANGIGWPYKVRAGQRLVIPGQ